MNSAVFLTVLVVIFLVATSTHVSGESIRDDGCMLISARKFVHVAGGQLLCAGI